MAGGENKRRGERIVDIECCKSAQVRGNAGKKEMKKKE